MIVVTSATSNTGRAVAHALLDRQFPVRVLGRRRNRLQEFVDRGAQAVAVENTDTAGLGQAFAGAAAVFVMLAPGLIPDSADYPAHQRLVIDANQRALARVERLQRVVTLSGWAANYPDARGPVWGLPRLEEAIDGLGVAETVHLRPGWFMENAAPLIAEVGNTGAARGLIPGDLPLPAIATADIGEVAADILTGSRTPRGRILELQGPADLTLNEMVAAIGHRVGRPAAGYQEIDAQSMHDDLLGAGFSEHMAIGTTQMTLDVAERRIAMREPRNDETRTPTTFEQFLSNTLTPEDTRAVTRG